MTLLPILLERPGTAADLAAGLALGSRADRPVTDNFHLVVVAAADYLAGL